MGKIFDHIDDKLAAWIGQQKMFFVASAPLDAEGLVNVSPKGLDSFRILGPTTVAFADLGGSGIETVAHLRENGRIVVLFNAFEGPPKIVRLHGRGEAVEAGDPDFETLLGHFPKFESVRSIIRIECTRISDSCGFGVPLYEFVGDRPQLTAWAERKGPEGIAAYRASKNAESLDGLPGLRQIAEPGPTGDTTPGSAAP